MTDWLFDTLLWTAALIALVLFIRRPIARWLGPQTAYALWAIPALRLILPPLELPNWLAPAQSAPTQETTSTFLILGPATPVATQEAVAGSTEAATDNAMSITPQTLLDAAPWLELGFVAWLIGAAIFMYLRFSAYFKLRSELLSDAREVGKAGKIRLVETPGTKAPLAFGVLDPVIAMPEGFMAQPDRTARDLALAHEMAHHEGRDLLINVAVQPLFALHWWNPLGRYGWLALRRDQEAACDARVVASKPAEDRAVYANLIASFAAGPNVALAAPMACPVLGDKSIIHRLRSLTMSDQTPRRRIAGRALLGFGVLALPLTASISYAESQAPEPPVAPAAPLVSAVAPAAPKPPAPPSPPEAPKVEKDVKIITIDPGASEKVKVETSSNVFVVSDVDVEEDRKMTNRTQNIRIVNSGRKMSQAEMDEILAEVHVSLAEAQKELENVPVLIQEALVEVETDMQSVGKTVVKMECRGDNDEVATVEEHEGQVRKVYLCQARVMAHALEGLKEARSAIAKNREIQGKMRRDLLETLDEQIENWEDNIDT
ncbi:M56 family metallopeptidase [uncultured Erythrobacter sp.]|uniref:M56 family metallopeptidase n=1 Tax=uncultured Erythrobacter sp. TaxID=263913 RepID=UPI002606E443|nr:M56 family metallopeptidase [uncultured Erythrobacter sp.]